MRERNREAFTKNLSYSSSAHNTFTAEPVGKTIHFWSFAGSIPDIDKTYNSTCQPEFNGTP